MVQPASTRVLSAASVAGESATDRARLFEELQQMVRVDRACAVLQLDRYTGLVARVAQAWGLDPLLGGAGITLTGTGSKAFEVIASGEPALVREEEWLRYPDLRSLWPVGRGSPESIEDRCPGSRT
jgi:hypothetical protein